LTPVVTAGHEPTYLAALDPTVVKRLKALRPRPTARYPGVRRGKVQSSITIADWHPAVRRMDLDAPLPLLARAGEAPREIQLAELYFYKDAHPLARQVLELGVLQRLSFPFHSPDTYRQIRDGKKPNAF